MTYDKTTSSIEKEALDWVLELYGISAQARGLSGYDDINFLLETDLGEKFVLKISDQTKSTGAIEAQNMVLLLLKEHSQESYAFPGIVAGKDNSYLYPVSIAGQNYSLRMLSYLEGNLFHQVTGSKPLYEDLGRFLGAMNQCLVSYDLPELRLQTSTWDLQYAARCMKYLPEISDSHYRRLVWYFLQQHTEQVVPLFSDLPKGLIHGDANDHNVLVKDDLVTGLIDFGDATYSHLINELAIALTYVMVREDDPIEAAKSVVKGYHHERPLDSLEIESLYYLIAARLCTSLCMSTHSLIEDPSNQYLGLHQQPVKRLMDWLISVSPIYFKLQLNQACSFSNSFDQSISELQSNRTRHISKAFSLSYQEPLNIVRGAFQYLYDKQGNTYLDGVNNITHVGHCHPAVVSAASTQMARLNTNTRYLYSQLNEYAQQLCDLLPHPLSVVFFVNSGTEANELALRMARTHTGQKDMLVIESAYHGNSAATLEVSPYKYHGKGGMGKKPFIHEVLLPDLYHGKFRSEDPQALAKYLERQRNTMETVMDTHGGFAGFIGESLLGCGGQIVLPEGYLEQTYRQIRAYGGVCIADEVQVGFGRVGSHFWGFQTQGVVPDIVTMGKPMGNGHPVSAVITTPEIADSFNNGMEYFNSFGGNPVSCEIGKAVLRIIEEEELQKNALQVGTQLKKQLNELKIRHEVIGEVRGLGLFLGIELVLNRESKAPASELAGKLVENMKNRGVLLSTDGPRHNVIKIKPPMVVSSNDIMFLADQLDLGLSDLPMA